MTGSSWPLVQFVDAPSPSATVRFDCNMDTATEVRKVMAFDPGVPAVSGDPDGVGQHFGLRSPSITVLLKGTTDVAMAALSALSKEQLRSRNWLMYQPSVWVQPVWFRLYRPGFQAVSLDRVTVDRVLGEDAPGVVGAWEIQVPLAADPFAYGERVTIPTLQVIQGPVDLTGPTRTAMRAVLPAIKGDAPTLLRVTILPATGRAQNPDQGPSRFLVGCVAGTASMSDPVMNVGTGDGLGTVLLGGATSTIVTDAAFFGGSYRQFTIPSGAHAPLERRLTGNGPAMPPGRYKVLVRVSGVTSMTLRLEPSGTPVTTDDYSGSADPGTGWYDLGETQVGVTAVPDDVPVGLATPVVSLDIGGPGTIAIDAFKFIPVAGPTITQATTITAEFKTGQPPPSAWATPQSGTFDGDSELYYAIAAGAPLSGAPALGGGFPVADPAAKQNLLVMMALQRGDGFPSSDTYVTDLNSASSVDVSYHPRYLYVGDGT